MTPPSSRPDDAHPTPAWPPVRIGLGWDRHRLDPLAPAGQGKPFILGGVPLDHDSGPVGHSDGDALLHALTDAILGALGLPDIGQLFPDDDPRNKDRDSGVFLDEAVRRMRDAGWRIGNIDAVIVLERPKLGEKKDLIRRSVAERLGVDPSAVNIKGKTGERVDATGEGRAVDVHVAALLVRDEGTTS